MLWKLDCGSHIFIFDEMSITFQTFQFIKFIENYHPSKTPRNLHCVEFVKFNAMEIACFFLRFSRVSSMFKIFNVLNVMFLHSVWKSHHGNCVFNEMSNIGTYVYFYSFTCTLLLKSCNSNFPSHAFESFLIIWHGWEFFLFLWMTFP